MARKRTYASRTALPRAPDDFTRIHGIGPIIEKRLHSAGIHTFAQLATLPAETVAALIPNLSTKQVTKQKWIHQARKLAASIANSKTCGKDPVISTSRQHYENFTFEFLLDEKNKTRRMQVVHVQSGDVDTWTKWDAERLIDFLTRHTGVRHPNAKSIILTTLKPKPTSMPSMLAEQPSEVMVETTSIPPIDRSRENFDSTPSPEISESTLQILTSADNPTSGTVPQQLPEPAVSATIINRICLLDWKTLLSNTNQSLHNLPHDQAFDVNLTLDLTNAALPDTSQIDLTASLYAKKLGDGPHHVIGETQSTIPYTNIVDLTIGNATLPQGLYRLEAFLTLIPNGASLLTTSAINTSFQGGLFQVY